MSLMIVPIPHFDSEMSVEAYWLASYNGKKMFGVKDNFLRMDEAFNHFGLEIVEQVGIEPLTGGKRLFVPLSRMQLISGLIDRIKLPPESLVCVLEADSVSDPDASPCIERLHQSGAQVALQGFPSEPDRLAMQYVDYIILDHDLPEFETSYAKTLRLRGVTPVLCSIPDMDTFNELRRDTSAYFTGTFYSSPVTRRTRGALSPIKVNALKLLNQINQEDFEFEDIIETIERDPYLSVSLLRFLNSTASGLSRQVESIPQAVTILGQNAVRQWAAVALSTTLGEDRPNEITKLALVRAKFAEDIAAAFELDMFRSALFMAGLFSLLDIMLEKPMVDAIREVNVSRAVQLALLERQGPLAPVMELIYAYERADWDRVSILMIQNHTDMDHISKAYLDALLWYRNLLSTIDAPPAKRQ